MKEVYISELNTKLKEMRILSLIFGLCFTFAVTASAQYEFDSTEYANKELKSIKEGISKASTKEALSEEQVTELKQVLLDKGAALEKPHMCHVSRAELQKMIDQVDERFHKRIMQVLSVPQKKLYLEEVIKVNQ